MSIINAKTLRVNMTDAERKLWKLLRSKILGDYKFRRQHTIGKFIADFVCVEAGLVVEVDGGQHCENAYDAERTAWLENCGWRVLRFWNNEVLQNLNGVAETLKRYLNPPSPGNAETALPPSPIRERDNHDLSHRGEVNHTSQSHA